MQVRLALSFIGVSLLLAVSTGRADQPEAKPDKSPDIAAGRQVMLRVADVAFHEGPSPDAAVSDNPMGGKLSFAVQAVDGDWLRIGGKWVRRSDAVPIETAVEFLSSQIEQQPMPFAYASRAWARIEQAQFDEAFADAEEAIRLDPNFALGYAVRGAIHHIRAHSDAALEDFDTALALDPKLSVVRFGRISERNVLLQLFANLAESRGDNVAELDAEKLPDDDRRLTAARLFDRAVYKGTRGEHREAIVDLEEAVRLAPELRKAGFFTNRGHQYLMLREYEKATADIREALSREPENAEHYESLGSVCEMQDDWDGAIEHYSRAYEMYKMAVAERKQPAASDEMFLDPSELADMVLDVLLYAYFERAEKRLANSDAAGAAADYNRAVELAPKSPSIRISRAMFLAEMGQFDEALKDCDAATELDPSSSNGLCGRGSVYLAKGDVVKAMDTFNEATGLFPRSAEPFDARADAWIEMGEFGRALDDLSQAITLDPDNPIRYAERATIFRELKRGEEAAADEKKAQELFGKLTSPR